MQGGAVDAGRIDTQLRKFGQQFGRAWRKAYIVPARDQVYHVRRGQGSGNPVGVPAVGRDTVLARAVEALSAWLPTPYSVRSLAAAPNADSKPMKNTIRRVMAKLCISQS